MYSFYGRCAGGGGRVVDSLRYIGEVECRRLQLWLGRGSCHLAATQHSLVFPYVYTYLRMLPLPRPSSVLLTHIELLSMPFSKSKGIEPQHVCGTSLHRDVKTCQA